MNEFEKKVEIIFCGCLDLDASEREGYISQACGNDEKLKTEVQQLLKYHTDEEHHSHLNPISRLGDTIDDRYVIDEKLGEGGMGIVYLATDTTLNKKVAIKIIQLGLGRQGRMRRFDSEQKGLAKMSHSGIASIYHSGCLEDATPYFVMEYVPGHPITDFCNKHCINIKERIGLFQEVCDAAGHAHSKDVIHRDLKPSNVLAFYEDSKPVIKVIDFGIAKALGEEHSEQTEITRAGGVLGTPLYMSPEQAEGSKVDTKTDIYSLGVLLYELLSGHLPFDREQLKNPAEFQRIICGEEPHKPSTKCHSAISSSPDTASKIAQERDTTSKGLPHTLRGDLDWIIMKCLEKETERRYESCESLKEDLTRYLHDETVLAGPPSVLWRIRKYAKRNSGLLKSVAAVFSILLIAIIIITSIRLEVLKSQERVRQVREALIVLKQGDDVIFDKVRLEQDIEAISVEDPALAAVLYYEWARISTRDADNLTLYHKIIALHDTPWPNEQLKENHIDLFIDSLLGIYALEEKPNRYFDEEQYVHILEKALKLATEYKKEQQLNEIRMLMANDFLFGIMDETVWTAIRDAQFHSTPQWNPVRLELFERAMTLFKDANAYWSLAENYKEKLICEKQMSFIYRQTGRYDKAIELATNSITYAEEYLGKYDLATINAYENLATCHDVAHQEEDAIRIYEEVLDRKTRAYGEISSESIDTLTQLGRLEEAIGNLEAGYAYHETALNNHISNFGSDNADAIKLEIRLLASTRLEDITEKVLLNATQLMGRAKNHLDQLDPDLTKLALNVMVCLRMVGEHERALEGISSLMIIIEESLHAYPSISVLDTRTRALSELLKNLAALERWEEIAQDLWKPSDDSSDNYSIGNMGNAGLDICLTQLEALLKLNKSQEALDFADDLQRSWGTSMKWRSGVYSKIGHTFYDCDYKLEAIPFFELAKDDDLNRLGELSDFDEHDLVNIIYAGRCLLETGQIKKGLDRLNLVFPYTDHLSDSYYFGPRQIAVQYAEDIEKYDYALVLWKEMLARQLTAEDAAQNQLVKNSWARKNIGLVLIKMDKYYDAIEYLEHAFDGYSNSWGFTWNNSDDLQRVEIGDISDEGKDNLKKIAVALIQCYEITDQQVLADKLQEMINQSFKSNN